MKFNDFMNEEQINEFSDSVVSSDLSEFGRREISEVVDLLSAMLKQGLPDDFADDGVTPAMNKKSGYVFLTNEDFEVAMLNGRKLESWYNTPYEGHEGFFDDLAEMYDTMHPEDQAYLMDIAEMLGREDELPIDEA